MESVYKDRIKILKGHYVLAADKKAVEELQKMGLVHEEAFERVTEESATIFFINETTYSGCVGNTNVYTKNKHGWTFNDNKWEIFSPAGE